MLNCSGTVTLEGIAPVNSKIAGRRDEIIATGQDALRTTADRLWLNIALITAIPNVLRRSTRILTAELGGTGGSDSFIGDNAYPYYGCSIIRSWRITIQLVVYDIDTIGVTWVDSI